MDEIKGRGLFFIGDPHVAATPPGQRLEGFHEQVMAKIRACLDEAIRRNMVPVFLGDLFNWPRENPNALLVDLMDAFREHRPFILMGNHDKYQARFTGDTSMAVLKAAEVVRIIDSFGPAFVLDAPEGRVLVGASPDATPLPEGFDRGLGEYLAVVWIAHHGICFPEFMDRAAKVKELPGIDWLVNGHIHRPQPQQKAGSTTWANPGNITRLTFTRRSLKRTPAAAVWTPGCTELEIWAVPHLPFADVFPDQDFPPEEQETSGKSMFLQGLERLAWRRTREGSGLKEFLARNLRPDQEVYDIIWTLYEEVTGGRRP